VAGVEQVGEVTETAGVAHIGVWSVVCRFGGFESEYWGGREVIDTAIYRRPASLFSCQSSARTKTLGRS
jgi:hypothetical protein